MKFLNNKDKKNLKYKEIPLLTFLSEEEFFNISNDIDILQFNKGEIIFHSHDDATKMYIILDGEIKISKIMSDGKEQILYIYESGDFVGGHNILSGDKYEYSAYALKKTKILTISSRSFNRILKNNNKLLISILHQSYERIRRAENLIDRLSVISTDIKVAKLLINLVTLYGKVQPDGVLIKFNITQEELGSLSGIARETMSRKLNQFEEEGIIKIISRGKILVKELSVLENMII